MFKLRSLILGAIRSRNMLVARVPTPVRIQKRFHHDDGPPQPFDNMPFRVTNRYLTTVFFSIFFGIGLWAPFIIVWYSMAKRTL